MTTLNYFFALFLLLFFSFAEARSDVTSFVLKNGMEVVVIEDHRAPIVTQMVWYRVGAADEIPGKSGVAHLLEHLLFKETENVKTGEFSKKVESVGGSDNAFTSQDYTGYYQRVASDYLELVMYYEADRMRNLKFSNEDFKTELEVVIEERNQRTDSNPGALFNEQNMASLYLNHPYGIPIVGWRHELENLTKKDVIDFYNSHYAPNNAILIVSGDVEPTKVKILAEKFYGKLERVENIVERARPQEPPQIAHRRLIFEDERVAQPYLVRTYIAQNRESGSQKTAAALTLLANLLGSDGIQSVLGKELQLKNKKAIYTNAYYDGRSYDDTHFSLILVPSKGVSFEELERELDRVIGDLLKNGVDEDHLRRIKFQYKAHQIYSLDSSHARARKFGMALTSGLNLADVAVWPLELQEVDSTEILKAANSIFSKKSSVTGWIRKPIEEDQ